MKALFNYKLWIICFSLGYIHQVSATTHQVNLIPETTDQPNPINSKLKFGAKLSCQPTLWCHWTPTFCMPITLFMGYHGKTIDLGHEPLWGWFGSRYISYALEIGISYTSVGANFMRKDIEPGATFFLYEQGRESAYIYCDVQMISIPIRLKQYFGKNRNFAMAWTLGPLFILSIYKKDWVAELSNQPGQKLLKEYIYTNNKSYNERDSNHIKDRKAFYNQWSQRKEKDKRTYLNIDDTLFKGGRIGFTFTVLGIEYETNCGFIIAWDIFNVSLWPGKQGAFSSTCSVGYNFNKLKWLR